MNSQPYLEKYAGRKSRHECPACHDKHSFTRYLDGNTGQVIDKSVGRCNRESNCGYHYTPKDFFRDNPQHRSFSESDKSDTIKKGKAQIKTNEQETGRIPKQYLIRSLGYKSNFVSFLCSIFDRDTLKSPTVERLMNDYYLGCTKNGSVIYWQVDTK
ncbi:MAG: PG0870-related protein, partial [Rikenellaceae bacterium]|nr:PG0870-related protein [Rikenellaceae bacterium]